jgi:hypothetical protein
VPDWAHDTLHDVKLLIQSRYGIVHLDSDEEERVATLLAHLADALGVALFTWSPTQGLGRADLGGAVYDTTDPTKALRHVAASAHPGVYHFRGLATALEREPITAEHLRDAGKAMETVDGAVLLTGRGLAIPESLVPRVATVSLPGPGAEDYRTLLAHLIRDRSRRGHVEVELSKDEIAALLGHLSGLTLLEAEKVLTKAIIEDGRLHAGDIRHVIEAKKAVVEKEGLLEYYPTEESMADVADLSTLKAWLTKRKAVVESPVRAKEFGLAFPRGVLLLGVPGCGKSLCAKAVSMEWGLPLLRLDTSNLYNKYIGETEKNFKRAMEAAERMSPVVLWIDELEKAFAAGGSEDGGVSQRVLGSFLSWMQERRGDVFVVATANQIELLPPEFLRKGRFDEIFFVDLPDTATRAEIFRIHLANREQDPSAFDLARLAAQADGFSGAEIEQVVLSGLYSAFTSKAELDTSALAQEIRETRPLAITMAEKIDAMRSWAQGRTIRAN